MSTTKRLPVIFLMGPTAGGKTDLAIALADRFPLDLISVDSALVYRGMDIGTAKPDRAILARYPHALIDIRDPDQSYCAGDFRRDALACIAATHAKGRIPLLVGGTGLYFRALEQGIADIPAVPPALGLDLNREAAERGWPALHAQLRDVDPHAAARIHPHDSQRIQRALAVYRATGRSLSQWQAAQEECAFPFAVLKLGLLPERKLLHERIEQRWTRMLAAGFLEELESLAARGFHAELPAMRAVGYRQLLKYLNGEYDWRQACEAGLRATRQLAKRQMTWLRRERIHDVVSGPAPTASSAASIAKFLR